TRAAKNESTTLLAALPLVQQLIQSSVGLVANGTARNPGIFAISTHGRSYFRTSGSTSSPYFYFRHFSPPRRGRTGSRSRSRSGSRTTRTGSNPGASRALDYNLIEVADLPNLIAGKQPLDRFVEGLSAELAAIPLCLGQLEPGGILDQ